MKLEYFFINTLKIEERGLDIGFDLYCPGHLIWLVAIAAAAVVMTGYYMKQTEEQREKTRKFFAIALLCSEILKDAILIVIGAPMKGYLPLHLCSINIFLIALHAWKPSRLLDNFLYFICIKYKLHNSLAL